MTDYNVQFPDGTPLVIQTGTINNTYDIPLVGQDAINYGDDFATAYIRLLSNFAYTSAPSFGTTRTAGQLWYDTTPSTGGLNVFDGTGWDAVPIDSNVVHIAGAETITGLKTFSVAPDFTNAGEPFTVNSTTTVANLSASTLDGNASTAFATALQGTKADAAEVNIGNPPVSGYIYSSTTGGVRLWISPTAGSGQVEPVDITDPGVTSPATMSVLLVDDPTGSQDSVTDGGLTYNGTTNTLSTTLFIGNLTGTASAATLATTATTATTATQVTISSIDGNTSDTTMYPVLVAANTATDQVPHLDGAALSYNASSNTLSSTQFVGGGVGLTGLAAGNISSGILAVARGGTGVSTSTGSGSAFVLSTSPTFTTSIITPLINNSSGVTIQWNGTNQFGSQDSSANGNSSGAFVFDSGANNRNVGFNEMDTTDYAVSAGVTLFNRTSAGHSFRSTHSSGAKIYQTEATIVDIPVPNGSLWIVRNLSTSTGTVTVQAGTGNTLRHYDGSGGTPPATVGAANPFTLARGGIATVLKVADGEYDMWGIGLTGGA